MSCTNTKTLANKGEEEKRVYLSSVADADADSANGCNLQIIDEVFKCWEAGSHTNDIYVGQVYNKYYPGGLNFQIEKKSYPFNFTYMDLQWRSTVRVMALPYVNNKHVMSFHLQLPIDGYVFEHLFSTKSNIQRHKAADWILLKEVYFEKMPNVWNWIKRRFPILDEKVILEMFYHKPNQRVDIRATSASSSHQILICFEAPGVPEDNVIFN